MGLYKLCEHKGRTRDRCTHVWWGSFQYRGRLHRQSLEKWSAQEIRTKAKAQVVLDRMKEAVRAGKMDRCQKLDGDSGPLTFKRFVYCPRVLGQWFDGIRFYAAASSPTRSRRTWAGLR